MRRVPGALRTNDATAHPTWGSWWRDTPRAETAGVMDRTGGTRTAADHDGRGWGVLEVRCGVCRERGRALCRRCSFALASSPGPGVLDAPGVEAALTFDGAVRTAVHALKFRGRRALARQLAVLTVERLRLGEAPRPDVVTWAPTSSARRRRRGYDQAELIARCIARELGVPCRRLLYRAHGAPQTGRSRAERLARSGELGFRSRPPRRALRLLLVDDVVTTGATLRDAAASLLEVGVAEVRCVAVAATPGQRGSRPASERTRATAGLGSSSTRIATMPSSAAGVRLVATSSRNAARSAGTPRRERVRV
jgi:ComF family protein